MASWSDGYFTDVQYTGKYFAHLAPSQMAFACLRQSVRAPTLEPGSVYLELGCGQGFGLNLLAAANPALRFFGIDFHPGQIANAQRLARSAGLENVVFEDLSFEQVLALPQGRIPRCEIIALHGVYSWVSPENRELIVRIIDRLLKPGGMVAISYNAFPAWERLMPLRRFVKDYFDRMPGDPLARAQDAFRAAKAMIDNGARGFGAKAPPMIDIALARDPAYLIHEYFNDHFHPLYHADVARELEGARLSFAASSSVAEDLIALAAPEKLRPQVLAEADPGRREALLDFTNDRQFRKDVFVRGRNGLSPAERDALLGTMRFALTKPAKDIAFEFQVPIGKLSGDPQIYGAVVQALAGGPRTYRELAQLPPLANQADGAVTRVLGLLIDSWAIQPLGLATPADGGVDVEPARALNRVLLAQFAAGEPTSLLAAPALGAAMRADFTDLLGLDALYRGESGWRAAADRGWDILQRSGGRLQKDGEALPDQASHQKEFIARLEAFEAARLPIYRELGVV